MEDNKDDIASVMMTEPKDWRLTTRRDQPIIVPETILKPNQGLVTQIDDPFSNNKEYG
jgi:hypothetical protein